ncbi:DUF4178 domain-containing protein [Pelomonas sp. BJYL3]|uniref:DUF4178 domain-containing protein n=1 Tax=Pelomonas sp. BJYL3 TaxID=2976697 RepID=UPI0022B4D5BF|nr:DUF4178 domain-containing protein [Pelomonas sp. BJYL3]
MASTSPQRRWQAACPNCGAPVEFASAASHSAVCSYCRATLLREGEALRKIGQSAELFEDYSPLQLGASGKYQGEPFTVLGRIQLRTEEASWNEWHILFGHGRSAWLSEDNGAFVIGFELPLAEAPPLAANVIVGSPLTLGGARWEVASKVNATVLACEGELPRPPELLKSYWVVELRSSKGEVGSLEFSQPQAPVWTVGRSVRLADLALSGLREDSSKTLSGKSLPCPGCGASLTPKLDSTQSIVCPQCHTVTDISKGVGGDLAHYAQDNGMEPLIPMGSSGKLALMGGTPQDWQVVGYMERCDLPQGGDEEQTFWREYLLFNRLEGFAFLVDTEEGWSVVRPLTGAPTADKGGAVSWQDKRFARRWQYTALITYVLGEFYWRVKRGEKCLVTDYEYRAGSRTELLSREQTGNEVTWSHGRKLDADEVLKGFALAPEKRAAFARDAGVRASGDAHGLFAKIILGAFVLLVLLLLFRACSSDDCQSYKETFGESSAEYQACKRSGGVRSSGGSGGSWGGYSSGGGGHK